MDSATGSSLDVFSVILLLSPHPEHRLLRAQAFKTEQPGFAAQWHHSFAVWSRATRLTSLSLV